MAAPGALEPVGGGHSKEYNSFLTPFLLPLVNYMQVFSFLIFFVGLIKMKLYTKPDQQWKGREKSVEEVAECAV